MDRSDSPPSFDPTDPMTGSSDPISEVLAVCLRAPAPEQRRELEEACAAHPDLADALRERFDILAGFGLESIAADAGLSECGETQIFGDFELQEVIGRGGMGIVHRAYQRSLDRDVVLKLIRPELLYFEGARRRFEREAGAIAQLQHPGIVPVHAVGDHDGVPFFVMERIEGQSLDARLRDAIAGGARPRVAAELAPGMTARDGARSWCDVILHVGRQVAVALHHAHSRGILHRDVKPSNVLLDDDGHATLIDFGLHTVTEESAESAATSRLTREGSAPGTLLYMAPEQLELGVYDVRSEVYTLAATLYELLAFEPPFRGSDRSGTERLIRAGSPVSLRAKNRDVPRDLDAVIQRALSVDPARRYVDMRAFEDDLARAADGRPVAARPDSLAYRVRRFAARQPALAAASVALLALAVATPTTVILQQRQHAKDLRAAFDEERDARLDAEDMANFVIDVLSTTDANQSEPNAAVREMLERGAARLHTRLGQRPLRRAHVQTVLGRIHGQLGLGEKGIELLEASLATFLEQRERLDAVIEPKEKEEKQLRHARSGVISARHHLAFLLEGRGRMDEAYAQRVALADDALTMHAPGSWYALHAKANAMRSSLYVQDESLFEGAPRPTRDQVVASLRAAVAAAEDSVENNEGDAVEIGRTYGWFGSFLVREAQGLRGEERTALLEDAKDVLEDAILALQRDGIADTVEGASAQVSLGLARKLLGDLPGAEGPYAEAMRIFEKRLPPEHAQIGAMLLNQAGLLESLGRFEDAAANLVRAEAILSAALGPENRHAVTAAGNLCGVRYRGGLHDGLIELYTDVIPRQVQAFGAKHDFVGASHENRGMLRRKAGEREEARADLEHAREIFRERWGEGSERVLAVERVLAELNGE